MRAQAHLPLHTAPELFTLLLLSRWFTSTCCLLSWCLMSSDVIWHIRDKLWPIPKHGSIRKVYACLAVTCHLHFWQNDRDFLRATVVTRGGKNGTDRAEIRVSTESRPWRRKFSRRSSRDSNPPTFQSRVRCSNHWAIPAPAVIYVHRNHVAYY